MSYSLTINASNTTNSNENRRGQANRMFIEISSRLFCTFKCLKTEQCHSLLLWTFVTDSMCNLYMKRRPSAVYCCCQSDLLHKSHNAPVPCVSHNAPFVKEMCTFLLQNGELWDICLMHYGIGLIKCVWHKVSPFALSLVDSWMWWLPPESVW